MIHLDTNYLIGLLVKSSPEAEAVNKWMTAGQALLKWPLLHLLPLDLVDFVSFC
jgi:hypothetical protein